MNTFGNNTLKVSLTSAIQRSILMGYTEDAEWKAAWGEGGSGVGKFDENDTHLASKHVRV